MSADENHTQAVNNTGQHSDYKDRKITKNYLNEMDFKYIDFESGNDDGQGTRDDPWKHHPWDKNSTGKSASSHGVKTYIFRKGVIYRGGLVARESGTLDVPIKLTVDPGWGQGEAAIVGSIELTEGWQQCNATYADMLPASSRAKAWCRIIKTDVEPRLLWYRSESRAIRIPIARFPDWGITDTDDPRSQWFELSDVILELTLEVSRTDKLAAGDDIHIQPNRSVPDWLRNQKKYPKLKIIAVQGNKLTLEVRNWHGNLLRPGDVISNGETEAVIKRIEGTHSIVRRLVDDKNLLASEINAYKGATIWAERRGMPKADAAVVTDYNPYENSLRANFHRPASSGPRLYDRYYLEGLPEFLNSAGEYVYRKTGKDTGVLVLRLPEDRNPNQSIIEVAKRNAILEIKNHSNIEVSGLAFRFGNQMPPGTQEARNASLYAAAIQISGDVSNITVADCEFSFLPAGIVAFPELRAGPSIIDGIRITGNKFKEIDGSAIALGNGLSHYKMKNYGSRLIHVSIRNNTLRNIGYRTLPHFIIGSQGVAIQVMGGEVVEVAENQVQQVWGSGISVTLGSEYQHGQVMRPFLRSLIHDNTITDSLLGAQDGGGINSWMGGPAYIYNNISGNPVGCMYSRYKISLDRDWYRRGCYGVGIYLDGQYKSYVFNNIIWGKNNNVNDRIYNSAAFNEAMGFMNSVFHNTFFRFGIGLHKGMFQHNRNYYLGNLFIDMGINYIQQEPIQETIDYSTLAFSKNQFFGDVSYFGKLGNGRSATYKDIDSWRDAMRRLGLMRHDTGYIITKSPVRDANGHDFRPMDGSPVIDAGVKVFVPWALYGVVGEWHFLRRNDDPSVINGENINMDSAWVKRDMYHLIPRNDLHCVETDASDFVVGTLEDWIPGALIFNGKTRYCTPSDTSLDQALSHDAHDPEGKRTNPEHSPVTLDMGMNNFVIEAVIKPETDSGPAGLVEKRDIRGYSLGLDPSGYIIVTLDYGNEVSQRASAKPIDDDRWHHLLVEVDRSLPDGISIYIDGEQENGKWLGIPMKTASLSNDADFLVGRSMSGYFSGGIDFLRVSRGTLAQAETDISELYAWEFDGPFLRDIYGLSPKSTRDVGAVEYVSH